MFDTPKTFASLSSGLLARKGAAKPAMRPQGFGQMGASLEDLGWNDMGFEAPKPAVSAQERDADHDAFGEEFAEQPLRNPVSALTPSPNSPAAGLTPSPNSPAAGLSPSASSSAAGLSPSPVHVQQAELEQQFGVPDDADDEGEEEVAEDYEADDEPVALPSAPLVLGRAAFGLPDDGEAPARISVNPEPVEPLPGPPAAKQAASLEPVAAVVQAERAVRAAPGSGRKAAFTLRLDAARHLRLRLACALTGRSAQMLVTDAVDKLLAEYPELENFADTLPDHGRGRRAEG